MEALTNPVASAYRLHHAGAPAESRRLAFESDSESPDSLNPLARRNKKLKAQTAFIFSHGWNHIRYSSHSHHQGDL
jgi:hypothetical protein